VLRDEFVKLQLEIEHKNKAVNDVGIKLKETKSEYIILQNSHQRLTRVFNFNTFIDIIFNNNFLTSFLESCGFRIRA